MFCKECGKKNSEHSKFCQYCAAILNPDDSHHDSNAKSDQYFDLNKAPYPYSISIWKLIIMSVVTFGLYDIYWSYKQWKSFNEIGDLKYSGTRMRVYSIFSVLTSYSLFKNISNITTKFDNNNKLEAGGLALLYFFLSRVSLGFIPLIFAQKFINHFWEQKYGDKLIRSKFGVWNWIIVIMVVLILIFAFSSEETSDGTSTTNSPHTSVSKTYNQDEIASSVVNIFCPSTENSESDAGGSGVLLSEDGIVLTNSHIIPQDKNNIHVGEDGCLVVLPDPTSGIPSEMYLADPIVIPGISDDYDLAYLKIYAPYYDKDSREYKGTYPKKFPAFDDTTRCTNEDVKLGESVRIFGYPAISGGYSLTVTDGVVSSFPGEGLIVTSAKISHGNSGGLAVDSNGCMLGVPSLVSSDESESLGVIYSAELVRKFSNEVITYINVNSE